jgi:hypothetical protein
MRANLADVPLSAGTWNATVPLQQSTSTDPIPDSAPLRLPKVEAGINGLLPTSWAPPIYSVSLLSKLRFALGGNGLLRQAAARSFLAQSCKRKNRPNQQKKTVRGLDNVGFIAASRLTFRAGTPGLSSLTLRVVDVAKNPSPYRPCVFWDPEIIRRRSPDPQTLPAY